MLGLGLLGRGFGLSRLIMAEMSYITLYAARTRAFLCNGKTVSHGTVSATAVAAYIERKRHTKSHVICCPRHETELAHAKHHA
jgi:hypothetical protein